MVELSTAVFECLKNINWSVKRAKGSDERVVSLRKDQSTAEEWHWRMGAEVELNAPGSDWG